MALTTAQLQTLHDELVADLRAYGYAAHLPPNPANWNGPADLLNLVRDGTNGGPAITMGRDDVPRGEIIAAIDVADFPALSGNPNSTALSVERRQLAYLTMLSGLDESIRLLDDAGTNLPIIGNLTAIFPAGTGTRARLVATASRFGSRAEELLG